MPGSMKILLTGATGFLGSHLLKRLLKEKHEVIILKRSFSNTKRIEKELIQISSYNIDKCALEEVFKEQSKIDIIIHTATCYGRSGENICKLYQSNTAFPLQLLELSEKYHVGLFMNTDTVLKEDLNEYALSKKQFLDWGKRFAAQRKIQFINMKLEHMYGPDDDDSKFVSYIIKKCKENVKELKLTQGDQQRDFIYIDDVVNAYLALLTEKSEEEFQEYEVGTGKAIKICDLVKMIHTMTKSKTQLHFGAIPYRENEIMESKADLHLLKMLGWKSRVSIESGLERCIGGI